MKVIDLIIELIFQTRDLKREIKMSDDEEGNNFKEIDGVYETDTDELIIYPIG